MDLEIRQLLKKEEEVTKNQEKVDNELETLDEKLKETESEYRQKDYSKEIYSEMLKKVKRDDIAIRIKGSQLDNQYDQVRNSFSFNKKRFDRKYLDSDMTKKAVRELSVSVREKKKEHKKFAQELREIVNQKKHVEQIEDALKVNSSSVNNSDFDHHKEWKKKDKEKKWIRLFYVHKFLDFFLEKKMKRNLKKYQEIEDSFRKIKSATGIIDPYQIMVRYLNRDKIQGEVVTALKRMEENYIQVKDIYLSKLEKLKVLKEQILNKGADKEELMSNKKFTDNLDTQIQQEKLNKKNNIELRVQRQNIVDWIENMVKQLREVRKKGLKLQVGVQFDIDGVKKQGMSEQIMTIFNKLKQFKEEKGKETSDIKNFKMKIQETQEAEPFKQQEEEKVLILSTNENNEKEGQIKDSVDSQGQDIQNSEVETKDFKVKEVRYEESIILENSELIKEEENESDSDSGDDDELVDEDVLVSKSKSNMNEIKDSTVLKLDDNDKKSQTEIEQKEVENN